MDLYHTSYVIVGILYITCSSQVEFCKRNYGGFLKAHRILTRTTNARLESVVSKKITIIMARNNYFT